jgi:hypothetical protein
MKVPFLVPVAVSAETKTTSQKTLDKSAPCVTT